MRSRLLFFLCASLACAQAQGPAEILARARGCVGVVERIRDQKFKTPVPMTFLSDDEVRKRFQEGYDEDLPVEKAKGLEAAYARMGLIPQDMDLRKTMFELEVSETAAFYDEKKGELCLLAKTQDEPSQNGAPRWTDLIAVHELTHALQDQLHDLNHYNDLPLVKDDSDVSFALTCVIEGEAMLVMMDQFYEAQGLEPPGPGKMAATARTMMDDPTDKESPLAKAPRFLRETLVEPYIAGLRFVGEVKDREGWAGVSDLFSRLPSSSEEVLHPRKYLGDGRDYPIQVKLPDLSARLPKGYHEVAHDSLGELGTRIRLEGEKVPRAIAESVSDGWGGDEFVAWNDGTKAHTALAWATTWDADSGAKRFFFTLRDTLARVYEVAEKDIPKGESACAWDTKAGGVAIEMRGRDVVSVEAMPDGAEEAKAAMKAIWDGMEKKELLEVGEKK